MYLLVRILIPIIALLSAAGLLVGAPMPVRALSLAAAPAAGDPALAGSTVTLAAGRVVEAVAGFDADGVLRTHHVLVDALGRETARFAIPGGVVGDARWVVDGVPAFVVGETVEVALAATRFGLTVADVDDAVVRLAPAADGRTGALLAGEAPTVTSVSPELGGATPEPGMLVIVRGERFGPAQGDSRVTFQGLFERVDAAVVSWSDQVIECRVPRPGLRGAPQVLSGTVKVWTAAGGWSDGDPFMNGPRFRVLYQWAGDRWPNARLPVRVWLNPEGFPGGAGGAPMLAASFAGWNTAGSYARLEYAGLTNAEAGPHEDDGLRSGDGRNTVRWRATWPHAPGILAVTWSLIDTLTYARREVDVEINGADYKWTTADEGDLDAYDLPSTLAHEFGHWLRLGHTQLVASVMRSVVAPGQRRREVSAADRFGASFIHPSYGTITAPAAIDAGAPLELELVARDRQGDPRAGLGADRIRAYLVPLDGADPLPAPLDSALKVEPLEIVYGDRPTDGDGRTTARFESVPRGLYRLEVTVDGELVRPVSVVRAGAAPLADAPRLALAGVTPQPLAAGVRGIVRFALPQSTHLKLDLYDVRGARVRAVADGRFAAGAHELPLWTRDEGGMTMAPGIYFLRMTAVAGATFAPLTARVVVLP